VPGDHVRATDPVDGKAFDRTVTRIHHNLDAELTDLSVTNSDGRTVILHTTPHHPFWDVTKRRWVEASSVDANDVLRALDGSTIRVASVISFAGPKTMDNFTVDDTHTCYVIAGNTPVLVHNENGGLGDNINLYGDYTARMDQFNVRGQASFEVHVYYRGSEVGIYGSNGFFNKHRISADDVSVPDQVNNRLKGSPSTRCERSASFGPMRTSRAMPGGGR
jgi:hypothetical protein